MNKGIVYALLAAAAFGASTPFSKILVGAVAPIELAGLLYLGSGLGLLAWFGLRSLTSRNDHDASGRLKGADMPWLAGAVLFGGIAGPVLLMYGLTHIPASYASLLLNMEGVLTSLSAWMQLQLVDSLSSSALSAFAATSSAGSGARSGRSMIGSARRAPAKCFHAVNRQLVKYCDIEYGAR